MKSLKHREHNIEAYRKHFKEFDANLNEKGLQLVEIYGDGNCLFRAVAEQLDGDQEKHRKYRRLAVKELSRNKHFY